MCAPGDLPRTLDTHVELFGLREYPTTATCRCRSTRRSEGTAQLGLVHIAGQAGRLRAADGCGSYWESFAVNHFSMIGKMIWEGRCASRYTLTVGAGVTRGVAMSANVKINRIL
jgi:hypothetical protein